MNDCCLKKYKPKLFQNACVVTISWFNNKNCTEEIPMNQKLERFMMKELIAIIAGLTLLSAVPLAIVIAGS